MPDDQRSTDPRVAVPRGPASEKSQRSSLLAALPLAIGLAASYTGTPATTADSDVLGSKPVPYSVAYAKSGLGSQVTSGLCALGEPVKDTAGWDFGVTQVVKRAGYELEHSADDKIALWVCEHVTKSNVTGSLGRPKPEPFAPDPELPTGSRAELKDYRGSGFDRGHQAPSADQTRSQSRQNETYYLSNMAPQAPKLNQQIWKALEERVRSWAVARGELYVITGPMFYDPKEENPLTATGAVRYKKIGPDKVAVPTHFYKIVASPPTDNGSWDVMAFVMENRGYARPFHLEAQLVSVKWVEDHTGLTFFPTLASDASGVKNAKGEIWPQ